MIYNNMKNGNFEQVAIITNEHLEYSKGFIISEMIKVEKELEMKEKEKLNAK